MQKKSDGVIHFIRNDCSFSYKEVMFTEANCLVTNITLDNIEYITLFQYIDLQMVTQTHF